MVQLDPVNAQLLLQIYEVRREEKLRRAREWLIGNFWAENLEEFAAACTPGSDENTYYRMTTSYWEMVASIVNRGIIDEELYFENNGEGLLVWMRVRKVALQMRKARKNPLILRNLERLSKKQQKWFEAQAPGALDETLKMLGAMRKAPAAPGL